MNNQRPHIKVTREAFEALKAYQESLSYRTPLIDLASAAIMDFVAEETMEPDVKEESSG